MLLKKTGMGYYVAQNGKKLHKFVLPLGNHPDPIGYTVVEVNSVDELNAITLDKSDRQLKWEKEQVEKESFRNSGKKKLMNLGLTEDEINHLCQLK